MFVCVLRHSSSSVDSLFKKKSNHCREMMSAIEKLCEWQAGMCDPNFVYISLQ